MKKLLFNCLFFCLVSLQSSLAQPLTRVQGELLIHLTDDTDLKSFTASLQNFSDKNTVFQSAGKLSRSALIYRFTFDWTEVNESDFLAHVRLQTPVQAAQFNHFAQRRTAPDDPFYGLQWQWNNSGQSGGSPGSDTDAETAWDITTGGLTAQGDTIVIAVIDDGMEIFHPDLAANMWKNYAEIPDNGIDDDMNGFIDDYRGWNVFSEADNLGIGSHGTAVAGIAGAVGNNGTGLTGLNWNVKIMAILASGGTEAEIIEGYDYALTQRQIYQETDGAAGAFVTVTNTSFGIDGGNPEDAPLWCAYFDILGEAGILSVAATTNQNVNVDAVGDLPTTCDSPWLISVTATDHDDVRNFSGHGSTHVDIAAPGENVWTLAQGEGVGLRSGTSFAAPAVSGLAALIYALPCGNLGTIAHNDPTFAAGIVRDLIYAGGDYASGLANEVSTGSRINAGNSLSFAQTLCAPCQPAVGSGATSENATELTLSFLDFSGENTDLFYSPLGVSEFFTLPDVTSPVTVTGLAECTEYEYYFVSQCQGADYISPTYTATTAGCCLPPTEITAESDGFTEFTINWQTQAGTGSVFYRFRYSENEEWIENATAVTAPFLFDDTLPCTQVEFQLKSICATGESAWSESIFLQAGGCGTCTDAAYCPAQGLTADAEFIDAVLFGVHHNNSGNDGGYGDFTDQTIPLYAGETVNFTLVPGYTFIEYPEYWRIWADLDQDGIFGENELLFDSEESVVGIVNGSIALPEDLLPGSLRLRISMKFLDDENPQHACETYVYGETEDYCAEVFGSTGGTADSDCAPPTNIVQTDSTATTATLTWEAVPEAEMYAIAYRALDLSYSEEIFTESPTVTIENLENCGHYQMNISAVCQAGQGGFSAAAEFAPACMTATEEVAQKDFAVRVFPNPTAGVLNLSLRFEPYLPFSVTVIDVAGKASPPTHLETDAGGNYNKNLDLLQNRPDGLYFLQITAGEEQRVLRVSKR